MDAELEGMTEAIVQGCSEISLPASDAEPSSSKNSVGSDLDLLLLDQDAELVSIPVVKGGMASSPVFKCPTPTANVTLHRGKGRPKIKKKSLSQAGGIGIQDNEKFRDIPVNLALNRVLRALSPSKVCP